MSRSHLLLSRACSHNSHRLLSAEYRTLGVIGVGTVPASIGPVSAGTRDDNGSAGHGSSGSTNLSGLRGSRVKKCVLLSYLVGTTSVSQVPYTWRDRSRYSPSCYRSCMKRTTSVSRASIKRLPSRPASPQCSRKQMSVAAVRRACADVLPTSRDRPAVRPTEIDGVAAVAMACIVRA